jgi:hypothetical protein
MGLNLTIVLLHWRVAAEELKETTGNSEFGSDYNVQESQVEVGRI